MAKKKKQKNYIRLKFSAIGWLPVLSFGNGFYYSLFAIFGYYNETKIKERLSKWKSYEN